MILQTRPLTVTINGRRYGPIDVPEGLMMIDVLHEMLGLTGSRLGCGIGICHACVVIWDRDDQTSEEVQTCITGAGFFDGKRIRTVEGIARRNDKGEILALSPVQQAFLEPRPGRRRCAEHRGGGTQQQHAKACRSAQPDRGDARRHRSAEFFASR
jgi:xanthine dehydrogenase iron-sulfur cluster and FAD-binding subunit A